jgi:hypothetical protein
MTVGGGYGPAVGDLVGDEVVGWIWQWRRVWADGGSGGATKNPSTLSSTLHLALCGCVGLQDKGKQGSWEDACVGERRDVFIYLLK